MLVDADGGLSGQGGRSGCLVTVIYAPTSKGGGPPVQAPFLTEDSKGSKEHDRIEGRKELQISDLRFEKVNLCRRTQLTSYAV